METFIKSKTMESNPGFQKQKDVILSGLDVAQIDPPLIGLIAGLNKLSFCFTLQVEPERFKTQDKARLTYREALRLEKARNEFFARLYESKFLENAG